MSLEPQQLEAFMRELTRHQSRLRGYVRCLLFDRRDADDVWQDVNVVLLRKAAEFQPGTNFWAWACSVTRYQILAHAKQLGRDRLVFDQELVDLIAAEVEQRGDSIDRRREALQNCLEKLPEPQRQLLEMRYAPAASLNQIAEKIGRPVGSVRQTLFRIREALLACIERRLAAEGAA
jgi:RNA polymerase sigma-70 factor (ECF subfamily)